MFNDTEMLQLFSKLGISLKLKGDTIEVSPRALITDKMRNFITANKTRLIAALKKIASEKIVTCNECDNFTPDPIGFGGIGSCSIGEQAWLKTHKPMPPYPYAERKCEYFFNKSK